MKYLYDEQGNKIWQEYVPVEKPKSGKKIALIVGHTQASQGDYGNEGLGEYQFNDEFIEELWFTLPKQHSYYIKYRSSDINSYTKQMVALHDQMDDIGIDISIEFHFNGSSDSSVNGNEVLYCASSSRGESLASILDECLDSLPNRDRGIKPVSGKDRGAGFCCIGASIALITEPFFGSEQSDFIRGGKDREKLKQAYRNFFERV